MPVDPLTASRVVVDPALKVAMFMGQKIIPSKQVKKGDKYMDAAREKYAQNVHRLDPKEAKRLVEVRRE
jgi:hypothetical protein